MDTLYQLLLKVAATGVLIIQEARRVPLQTSQTESVTNSVFIDIAKNPREGIFCYGLVGLRVYNVFISL